MLKLSELGSEKAAAKSKRAMAPSILKAALDRL
jgi:hypothetical protein